MPKPYKQVSYNLQAHADSNSGSVNQQKAINHEAHSCADERPVAANGKLGSPKPENRLKLGLWNVRSCHNECKMDEIESQLWDRGFTITILTETEMPTNIRLINRRSMLYTSGREEGETTVAGVGFLIGKANNATVLKFDNISDRLARLTIIINGRRIGLIAAYAPTNCSDDEHRKDLFFSLLQREVEHTLHNVDDVLIGGDFNCRINMDAREYYPRITGPHAGDSETTENGFRVLDLCYALGLRIENTYFDKPDRKKFTRYHFCAQKGAMLDLLLTRNTNNLRTIDVRASRGADANSDHVLVTSIIKASHRGVRWRTRKRYASPPKPPLEWKKREVVRSISS